MALYHVTTNSVNEIEKTDFEIEKLKERQDLQRLLKKNISVIGNDLLIISEEFGEFSESSRRIDLLAVDSNANIVVIELKRTSTGNHMDLQAIRYASMVSNLTWEQTVTIYGKYLTFENEEVDAESDLLQFLGWDYPQEDDFAQDIRIILASANFSKELTTSVLWLNERDLDISCVKLQLHKLNDEIILNAEQVIPLPESEDYQVGVREKRREARIFKASTKDRSLFTLKCDENTYKDNFKKSDIGLFTVLAINEYGLLNSEVFEFLRNNNSCSFQLLKTVDEMTSNETKYSKYRYKSSPELTFNDTGYYVARNWGINNIDKFINVIEERFPSFKFSKTSQ